MMSYNASAVQDRCVCLTLCRAPFDNDVSSLELENNELVDNGEIIKAALYNDEAVVRSMLDRWVSNYDLIMLRAVWNGHESILRLTLD